jgi:phage/plasmid-like protein (TIGR03299 family)
VVRKPAWHGLALVLAGYPGREEAMKFAGHNWQVLEGEVCDGTGHTLDDYKMLYRSDNGYVLSVVPQTYTPIQNDILWDITDAILDQDNVMYETAGVLKKGKVAWVLARLNEPDTIPGDNSPIYPYVMVATAHDRTRALKAANTSVRVVCWNTYTVAERQSKANRQQFNFKHTKNAMNRIDEARSALGLARAQHLEFIELARELARHEVNDDGVKDFLSTFIPNPPADVLTPRAQKNVEDARFQIYELLNDSVTIPDAHRRTSYGLYTAGVEYLDHLRKFKNPESYFNRTFSETAAKGKLAKLALEVS